MMLSLIYMLALLTVSNGQTLFTKWVPYATELVIPKVIDMRNGGSLKMDMGSSEHYWGGGLQQKGLTYGYAKKGQKPTYPGPTILVKKGVPINITWHNNLKGQHILDNFVAPELLTEKVKCYPNCGVPAIVHVHGMEVPAIYDGLPQYSILYGQNKTDTFAHNQIPSTMVYHDHAMGFTRLNAWAGMVGAYIMEDEQEKELGVAPSCDIPLIIQDKLILDNGSLTYVDSPCSLQNTKWAPEGYGNVNVVNGVVMPYVKVPNTSCRLRFINAANARTYSLDIPFHQNCKLIAKDSGLVRTPIQLDDKPLVLYPFERVELLCDFSAYGTAPRKMLPSALFNIVDLSNEDVPEGLPVMQFKVVKPKYTEWEVVDNKPLATTLNKYKDLKELWKTTNGTTRDITLNEIVDAEDCPVMLTVSENNSVKSFMKGEVIQCEKGKVEKWRFHNPTADFHPFHWHVVHFQCGADDDSIETNELKDVFPIPNSEGNPNDVTQVCYVACTPSEFLIEDSTRTSTDFGFSTKDPYLVHCHILEHEENEMMTWFQIV